MITFRERTGVTVEAEEQVQVAQLMGGDGGREAGRGLAEEAID